MTDLKHTHYSPYGAPHQVPGTLLDCTPEYDSYHRLDGSELWADYAYYPRVGPVSATGLPSGELARLLIAYTDHRSPDTEFRIVDVVADPKYTYRVTITNRTAYPLNEPGPTWHTEEWGIFATHPAGDGQWRHILVNPHPGIAHIRPYCPNCGH